MKLIIFVLAYLSALVCFCGTSITGLDGDVVIKETALVGFAGKSINSVVESGATFEVSSTDGGFLSPRMTTTQRDNLSATPQYLEITNTTTKQKEIYIDGVWQAVAQASVLTAKGDIIYYNNGYKRLARGTNDQILKMASEIPSWANESSGGRIIGSIIDYAGAGAADHTLICNGTTIGKVGSGAAQESASYETLFDIIKASWGNAGTEDFASGDTVLLPNLLGMFTRATGTHSTLTMANGNAFAGPAVGESEDDQFQGHWHTAYMLANAGTGSQRWSVDEDTTADPGGRNNVRDAKADGTNGTPRTGDETRPVSYGVSKCIIFE